MGHERERLRGALVCLKRPKVEYFTAGRGSVKYEMIGLSWKAAATKAESVSITKPTILFLLTVAARAESVSVAKPTTIP